ncbi:putative Acyl carrier protein [Desulfamplus magnetovallimortis]|uniref:Putative Acyl carrier protein n=1 Tax=Desulfamplus magnetovallimortis TaxID=1246637 RepID=L0R405_9BACT|nr:acyl carrier protein [Desulfamplus magnetovallimortis]CCO06758.1 putative Acyl carrier protein [Desulfamplus magnetovallimortis BW-1]SLM32809.1 putative Acyl carrier protein [Desulfamplus magnetovallimortis]
MVSEDTIREKLLEFLTENTGVSPDEIGDKTLFHDIGIDSLMLVELFVFIEKEFAVNLLESNITHDDIMSVTTLAAAIKGI